MDYRNVKSWILKPASQKDMLVRFELKSAEIHFKAPIQAFSISASSSSQYDRTISTEESCDLNGNHPAQQATNVFYANRYDFAFPPRTYESPRHIALLRSANTRDIPTRTRLHLPQCGAGYVRPIRRCTFEASLPARGRSHRSDVPMAPSSCFSI